MDDVLGIAAELEQEMQRVVDRYQCEWQTTLASPDRLALFRRSVNDVQPTSLWNKVCTLKEIPRRPGSARTSAHRR